MGAPKIPQTQGSAARAGAIHRVLRVGGFHVCGFCRSRYEEADEALSCVDRCYQEWLALNPVIARKRQKLTIYRCRYCARDYGAHSSAASCAADCRAGIILRFEEERSLIDSGELPPPPARRWRERPDIRPVVILAPRQRQEKSQTPTEPGAPKDEGLIPVTADMVRPHGGDDDAMIDAMDSNDDDTHL